MKTFRRFYGDILEQVGGMVAQPSMGGSSAQRSANAAYLHFLRRKRQADRAEEQRVQRLGGLREQISSPSSSFNKLMARREAARQKTIEILTAQKEQQDEIAAQREEKKQRDLEIQDAIKKDRQERGM